MKKHWGRGRFQHLTDKLDSPQARAFSARLRRACGCQLAWHRLRGAFVVFRDRGNRDPVTYLDVGGDECPMQFSWIPYIARAVRWGDAKRNRNYSYLFDNMQRADRDVKDQELDRLVDERLPDFYRDSRRLAEIARSGRYSPKFVDLGATK